MTFLFLALLSSVSLAENFDDFTRPLHPGQQPTISVQGYQRIRSTAMYNLDLDYGTTPSGDTLFPVPANGGQWMTGTDMRLRTDVSAYSPRGLLGVFVRLDFLDQLRLGADPIGSPTNTTSQNTSLASVAVRRAYGTILTPVGFFVAGRMGTHWGLGILSNAGDCIDCNTSDASDRIAFITPLAGHLWSIAYDFSASGVGIERSMARPDLDMNPLDDVHNLTFAVLQTHSDTKRRRRRKADRWSVEYGLLGSLRWQTQDVPVSYTNPSAGNAGPTDWMYRGYSAQAVDGWFRVTGPSLRIEAELAYLHATIEQPSLYPEILVDSPLVSDQVGFALETEIGSLDSRLHGGLHLGYASGDAAPGFGSDVDLSSEYGQGGDIDGAQFALTSDMRIDNFRFHPDYRIDRILFREIIGTVTDVVYLKPHMRYAIAQSKVGSLFFHQSAVLSFCVEPNSAPGGRVPLGLEWDPSFEYVSEDGFGFQLDYGLLLPLAGLHNAREQRLSTPAQLVRAHIRYRF